MNGIPASEVQRLFNQPPPSNKPLEPKPGWTRLSMQDTLPICLFSSPIERDKAQLIDQVKKQTLRADESVTFGVFGPWCLNKECDDVPMLQCWAERDGQTITVHTRYGAFHKTGSHCTKDCFKLDAACSTDRLARGTYTIRHGTASYPLKIPSVMRSPCLHAR